MTPTVQLINGRYTFGRLIGRGGFAEVFLAVDEKTHERVAIKLFRDAPAGSERIAAKIGAHPHIVQCRDQGTSDGRQFAVFDYVEGPTLRQRLEESKHLSSDEVSRLAAEIGSALDYAHRHGVLHNDLKPENIILSQDGAQLLDFGSARSLEMTVTIQAAQQLAGTVRYMAPEVLEGDKPSVQSDVYAFGMVLFEAITGRLPRQAIPDPELTDPRESLPPGFASAFAQALSPIPEMRQETAGMLADALQPGAPTTVINPVRPTVAVGAQPAAASRRIGRRWVLGLAGVAVVAGVVALGAATSFGRSGDRTTGAETPVATQLATATADVAAGANASVTATPTVASKANDNADKAQPKGKAKGKN